MELLYKITNYSHYGLKIQPIQETLINNKIQCSKLYIPYFYHQGSYNDLFFVVELFYSNKKIFEYEIEFELFDDSIMNDYKTMDKKTYIWKPSFSHNKNIEYSPSSIDYIDVNSAYILDKKLYVEFDIEYCSKSESDYEEEKK